MTEVIFMFIFKLLIGIVVGGVLGSFFGVIYYRVPQGQSIIKPPSHCDHCKTPLKPRDLIPVVSYCMNKGQCRFCGVSIGQENLVFEIVFMALMLILIFSIYPTHFTYQAPLTDFIHQG